MKINHYVYCITEHSTSKKYIGVRSCDKDPEQDIGYTYFSSSSDKVFMRNQKLNRINYSYEVMSQYDNRLNASLEEVRLHHLYQVNTNEMFINKFMSTSVGFNPGEFRVLKDCNNNIYYLHKDDPFISKNDLKGISYGLVSVKDVHNNYLQVSTSDPRYVSGELVHITKGMTTCKDKYGNRYHVSCMDPRIGVSIFSINKGTRIGRDIYGKCHYTSMNDPRFITKELVHPNINNVTVCDIQGNRYVIDKSDNRIGVSLFHINKGYATYIDNDNITYYLKKDDPIIKEKELVHIAKNKLCVTDIASGERVMIDSKNYDRSIHIHHAKNYVQTKDKDGNAHLVLKDDHRILSGELVHITKGMISVKDKMGNTFTVSKDDPRYINGDVIGVTGFWIVIDNILYAKSIIRLKYGYSNKKIAAMCKNPDIMWTTRY